MAMRDLIPWNNNRGREVSVRRGEEATPFLTLHREMNRLFDDVFRGFDIAPFGSDRSFERTMGWPNIEVNETDKQVNVIAELPGLEEKDMEVELADGALSDRFVAILQKHYPTWREARAELNELPLTAEVWNE